MAVSLSDVETTLFLSDENMIVILRICILMIMDDITNVILSLFLHFWTVYLQFMFLTELLDRETITFNIRHKLKKLCNFDDFIETLKNIKIGNFWIYHNKIC